MDPESIDLSVEKNVLSVTGAGPSSALNPTS